jgi:hypothetical protein
MSKIRYRLLPLIVVVASCATQPVTCSEDDETWTITYRVSDDSRLLIPLGSTPSPTFSTVVLLDDRSYEYGVETDGFGNSWASIAESDIGRSAELTIRYIITKREIAFYRCIPDANATWLEPNYYIDWQDPSVLSVARELNLSELERPDAVRKIGDYVAEHLTYVRTRGGHPASAPASITLSTREGVCINYSRLFVALCRASGIPARTVNGVVRNHDDPTTYEFHHEWMEYLDGSGYWHPVDLRYTNSYELNDPRYAGFVYGAEDHPWFAGLDNENLLSGQPVQLESGDVVLFHYHPIFPGARFGFRLVGSRNMESYIIEKTIRVRKTGNALVIEQSPAN